MDTLEARGVFYFETPARLRWELRAPYASILIHNDGGVAKFNVENGGLRKMNLAGEDILRTVLGQMMAWMRGDFDAARETYRLDADDAPDGGLRLVLRPRKEEFARMVGAIELQLDPATLHVRRVIVREPGNDTVEIRFSNEQSNPTLAPKLFDLEQPAPPQRRGP